jgi:hypothetical protein
MMQKLIYEAQLSQNRLLTMVYVTMVITMVYASDDPWAGLHTCFWQVHAHPCFKSIDEIFKKPIKQEAAAEAASKAYEVRIISSQQTLKQMSRPPSRHIQQARVTALKSKINK